MNKKIDGKKLLGDFQFISGYSKYNEEIQKKETWLDSTKRVMGMHYIKYKDKIDSNPKLKELFDFAHSAYDDQLVLASQRSLQYGGEPTLRKQMRIYNCAVTYLDRIRAFQEIMFMLMMGCGVGFSAQTKHIAKLPKLSARNKGTKTYIVPDTSEGWADSFGVLLSSYVAEGYDTTFPEYQGYKVYFDYSLVRPEGAYITGGFKAPSHKGLKKSIEKVQDLLDKEVSLSVNVSVPFRSIVAYDVVMHMSDAVLSGGLRRSATICVFSFDDTEMMKAKTGDWYLTNPQRGRSNNSVALLRDTVTREQFDFIIESTKQFGEPAFVFVDDEDILVNPCVTSDTTVKTTEGTKLVKDLIGKPFNAIVDGSVYKSLSNGFWKTGTKPVYQLETKKGFKIKATGNHQFQYKLNDKDDYKWEELSNIPLKSKIRLNDHTVYNSELQIDSEFERGWAIGSLIGDGTFIDNSAHLCYWGDVEELNVAKTILNSHFKSYDKLKVGTTFEDKTTFSSKKLQMLAQKLNIIRGNKILNSTVETQSDNFIKGVLRGYFDSDGSVQGTQEKGVSIRLTSIELQNLEIVQRMLLRFGIMSSIYKNRRIEQLRELPDGRGGTKEYLCKHIHELVISKQSLKKFNDIIGFFNKDKSEKLVDLLSKYKRQLNNDKFYDTVVSINLIGYEDVYDVTIDEVHAFDANGFYAHNCVEISFKPLHHLTNESGWQTCVSHDTKLITKTGIETIGNLSDNNLSAEIWNGEKWSLVTPVKTGENKKLYRVLFGDGSYLDCTDNHTFLVKNRFEKTYRELETKDLIKELVNTKYTLSVPRVNITYDSGIHEEYAYEYGYILGDGCATIHHKDVELKYRTPFASLYEDINLPLRGNIGTSQFNSYGTKFHNIYFIDVDKKFSFELKYDYGLPKTIFTWDRNSIINFVAGWIDADGSAQGNGCRLYGEEHKLRDAQLLLTKIGVNSSINKLGNVGDKTSMNLVRKRELWYLQIADTKDLKSYRLNLESKSVKAKGKSQTIKDIILLDGIHDTYCFTENEKHQGVFNNVLTKQCNLTEINGLLCKTREDFLRACKASAIIGTFQAGFTYEPYLGKVSQEIMEHEALLGCSITGFMNNPKILFDEDLLREGAKLILEVNEIVAEMIGINPTARATCTKPSGNASVMLGTTSGIHGEHSKRYLRHKQLNKMDEYGQYLYLRNPEMFEDSVWSSTKSDWSVAFPIEAPEHSIFNSDLKGVKLLEYVLKVQNSWVEAGTRVERCVHPKLRHNVSNTISVDNWDEVADFIFEHKDKITGVSLLSDSGDKDYNQAPYTAVYTPKEMLKEYGDSVVFASGLIVDGLKAFDNNLWLACDTAMGIGLKLSYTNSEVENIINKPFENNDERLRYIEDLWVNLGIKRRIASKLAKTDELPTVYEYKEYLDNVILSDTFNGAMKKDWIRRFKSFANKYLKDDKKKTSYLLKDVYNWHKWSRITANLEPIDWSSLDIQPQYTDIDTLGAIACSGGACEI